MTKTSSGSAASSNAASSPSVQSPSAEVGPSPRVPRTRTKDVPHGAGAGIPCTDRGSGSPGVLNRGRTAAPRARATDVEEGSGFGVCGTGSNAAPRFAAALPVAAGNGGEATSGNEEAIGGGVGGSSQSHDAPESERARSESGSESRPTSSFPSPSTSSKEAELALS